MEPVSLPFPPQLLTRRMPDGTNIERIVVPGSLDHVVLGLPHGVQATVEIRVAGMSVEAQKAQRPVVYLDQNIWSVVDAVRSGRGKVGQSEHVAAERLIALAADQSILLPASSGHLVETGPMYGARRVSLASTVLQLSRGWQMRNPLWVRVDEFTDGLRGRWPGENEVFAPQADGLFGSERTLLSPKEGIGSLEALLGLVASILAVADSIVDAEAIPDEGGAAAANGWASNWAEISKKMHDASEPANMFRRAAGANVIWDAMDSVGEAAQRTQITTADAITRLTDDADPIAEMPFLAQMRQHMYYRLRNRTQRWEGNHLTDIMFLCCAAAYADLVVGEKQTVGYLRQARSPAPRAQLATKLAEALALIEATS